MSPTARMLLLGDLAACATAGHDLAHAWSAANIRSGRRQRPDLAAEIRQYATFLRTRGPEALHAAAWARWAERLERWVANLTCDATPTEFAAGHGVPGVPSAGGLPPTWN